MAKTNTKTHEGTASRTSFKFRARITVADVVAIGPGKVSLLEAIREHGSITAAARSMGMSYRRAWLLVQELNKAMQSPAVVSEHGGEGRGGTTLTPEGEAVIRLYRQIEVTAARACKQDIDGLLALLQ
ncbi:LysR family transcriptional regulator [Cupriavidus pauculus]|jgi:molybdate transport system regulatory protein|uniref:LysR family transcriptional regulator n=1 Tax=Cupriavidus pauculus TaxID=82633 RepID=A0A5P2HD21_9BURK|nr:winged helix-turn-helix domain-containing protein [Cupriavidus pauculus]QET05059.1 LysR family transcriptional regulator [Cupriavidus pauculus]